MSKMLYMAAGCIAAIEIPTKPCAIHKGSFHTLTVDQHGEDKEAIERFEAELEDAYDAGWYDTTTEAATAYVNEGGADNEPDVADREAEITELNKLLQGALKENDELKARLATKKPKATAKKPTTKKPKADE